MESRENAVWKQLGDVTNWKSGGTPSKGSGEYWNGHIPWVSAKSLSSDFLSSSSEKITQLGLDAGSRLAQVGAILLLVRGSGLFKSISVGLVMSPVAFNQDIKAVTPSIEIQSEYLFLWFKGNERMISGILETTGIGAGKLDLQRLKSLPFLILPEKERTCIIDLGMAITRKIDLLKRQNKTLEGMAEALFRQWFIEEAQDDWEEVPLTHLIQLVGGGTPKTSVHEFWGGDIPWLAGGDITEHDMNIILKTEKSITREGLQGSSAKLLPKWSTVISARGTVGKITMLGRSSAFSQSNYGIVPSNDESYCFTFLLVSNETKRLLNAAYGAVFDTITKRTFEGLKIACPPRDVINSFEEKVRPLFKRQLLNQEQISSLLSQRDTLLPKLMSGEVRVNLD